MSDAAHVDQVDDEHEPMLAGTFALYQMPDGGLCLVTETPAHGLQRRVIPAKLIRMVTTGPLAKMFGNIFGGEE